jgi:hypothetical protein
MSGGTFCCMVFSFLALNGLRIKKVAEANLGEGA